MSSNNNKLERLTPTPPLGWNSYDSFGCCINEKYTLENLEIFAKQYKPYGYEYFVIDNGWFSEYEINPETGFATAKHAKDVNIDEYGRYIPSPTLFPKGLEPIINRAHELGVKFGVHMMRGISTKAYKLNTRIKGTTFTASDITDNQHQCMWCHYNYGVDMLHPAGQAFYDSVVELLASWGIDFIKVDDITYFPDEVEAYAKAIESSGRDIVLSLSPGGDTSPYRMQSYTKANMLRTTVDIWDDIESLENGFKAWKYYRTYADHNALPKGFWFDLDMIPFGNVCVWNPSLKGNEGNQLPSESLFSGKGYARHCAFTKAQMNTFLTQRAMAASPLFAGGNLLDMDEYSYSLLTNKHMIACNQNGIIGSLIAQVDNMEIWYTPSSTNNSGWIGVFNRKHEDNHITKIIVNIISEIVRLNETVYLVWQDVRLKVYQLEDLVVKADDVVFITNFGNDVN